MHTPKLFVVVVHQQNEDGESGTEGMVPSITECGTCCCVILLLKTHLLNKTINIYPELGPFKHFGVLWTPPNTAPDNHIPV